MRNMSKWHTSAYVWDVPERGFGIFEHLKLAGTFRDTSNRYCTNQCIQIKGSPAKIRQPQHGRGPGEDAQLDKDREDGAWCPKSTLVAS